MMTHLPYEIVWSILEYMLLKDAAWASGVSRTWREAFKIRLRHANKGELLRYSCTVGDLDAVRNITPHFAKVRHVNLLIYQCAIAIARKWDREDIVEHVFEMIGIPNKEYDIIVTKVGYEEDGIGRYVQYEGRIMVINGTQWWWGDYNPYLGRKRAIGEYEGFFK